MNRKLYFGAQVIVAVAMIFGLVKLLLIPSMAASLGTTVMRFSRMKTSSPTEVLVYFVPMSVATETQLRITFASGITVGAGISATTAALPAGITGLPGTLAASGAGQSAVITISDLTVGTTYGVVLTAGVSTPSSANSYLNTVATVATGTVVDQTIVASRFITDDQIVITGNVPPTFSFTLSGNSDTFTTDLSTSTVSTNGRTVQVSTNAAKGWIGWVKSTNAGLVSVAAGTSIPTAGTIDAAPSNCPGNSDCYVLDADITTSGTGSGSLTLDAEYNGTTGSTSGGSLSTSFQRFAYRTGYTDGDTITLYARASVSGSKPAASDYTDTLTVVGAGNF